MGQHHALGPVVGGHHGGVADDGRGVGYGWTRVLRTCRAPLLHVGEADNLDVEIRGHAVNVRVSDVPDHDNDSDVGGGHRDTVQYRADVRLVVRDHDPDLALGEDVGDGGGAQLHVEGDGHHAPHEHPELPYYPLRTISYQKYQYDC